jgi:anti-sigma factor RsiW
MLHATPAYPMNCSDFLASYTDYRDGVIATEATEAIRAHLNACPSCRRYANVLEHGASVLRSLPTPELREDFKPRLRHRLYHVDDGRALNAHLSGAPTLTVLGIAIILTALAWTPAFRASPRDVRLEPIVVDRAPRRASPVVPVSLTPLGVFGTKRPGDLDVGLWDRTLLYEYSALSQRYNQRARARRIADPDR